MDEVRKYKGNNALEIGCGSGIVLNTLTENFNLVVGTDLDRNVFQFLKVNPFINNFINYKKNEQFLLCCDSVSPIINLKFDLIVSNPPYLPDDEKIKDITVHGGNKGFETPLNFINQSTRLLNMDGKILIVISSLISVKEFESELSKVKIKFKITKTKKLFFEELFLYEIEQK